MVEHQQPGVAGVGHHEVAVEDGDAARCVHLRRAAPGALEAKSGCPSTTSAGAPLDEGTVFQTSTRLFAGSATTSRPPSIVSALRPPPSDVALTPPSFAPCRRAGSAARSRSRCAHWRRPARRDQPTMRAPSTASRLLPVGGEERGGDRVVEARRSDRVALEVLVAEDHVGHRVVRRERARRREDAVRVAPVDAASDLTAAP